MTLAERSRDQMIDVWLMRDKHLEDHRCSGQCPVAKTLMEAAYELSVFKQLPSPDPRAYAEVAS